MHLVNLVLKAPCCLVQILLRSLFLGPDEFPSRLRLWSSSTTSQGLLDHHFRACDFRAVRVLPDAETRQIHRNRLRRCRLKALRGFATRSVSSRKTAFRAQFPSWSKEMAATAAVLDVVQHLESQGERHVSVTASLTLAPALQAARRQTPRVDTQRHSDLECLGVWMTRFSC